MNRGGHSQGAGGRWTPKQRGRSSRSPFHSTNSAPGGSGRPRGGSPLGHNIKSFSCERLGKERLADDISEQLPSMSLLDNPNRRGDSFQYASSPVGPPEQVASSIRKVESTSTHALESGCGKKLFEEIDLSEQCSQDQASNVEKSENLSVGFDICRKNTRNVVKLKPSLLAMNRGKRNETRRNMDGQNIEILCDGMVLLRKFIPLLDQVRLVKTCRELGIGHGGFYQPGYRDGSKLHLRMMCLGRNWDPETSQYSDERPCDGSKPPEIPDEFHDLVRNALCQSRSYMEKQLKCKKIDAALPLLSPNICIVNFYTASGRLGLHQDKDESRKSIDEGLPVVSFSIGDTAEFVYGSEKDIEKAKKVLLESGDVLIFGGKSRLIYHGVSSIISKTTPEYLLDETDLKPGRLNLTFRQF
ncbi:unnamed protein product [Cuscuta epithymum]|uniref:Fe2OG dioxygenase domain-containing protein n=1 Tax=Cuscuta epithymum TaxID=186058 RepID=A0AAV0GCC6_9ASTE|nr:unnamed protein product [Cuscuta epithymum]